MKSRHEQHLYFQNLADTFETPTFICSKDGDVLFVNKIFKTFYGADLNSIKELMNINELNNNILGKDLEIYINGRQTSYIILKLMNRSELYQDDIFIVTFKNPFFKV